MDRSKLGQFLRDKSGGFTKVARHFNIPSEIIFLSGAIFPSGIFSNFGGPKGHILSHGFPSGALTELAAHHPSTLQWNYTPEDTFDREILLHKSTRKFLPTYGIIRITFCLYEFLTGTVTFMGTHGRKLLASCHHRTRTIQIPQRNPYSWLANFAHWSYHSPMVSTHSYFKITPIFLI